MHILKGTLYNGYENIFIARWNLIHCSILIVITNCLGTLCRFGKFKSKFVKIRSYDLKKRIWWILTGNSFQNIYPTNAVLGMDKILLIFYLNTKYKNFKWKNKRYTRYIYSE